VDDVIITVVGSVKVQAAERENWNCDKCRTEKVRMLQEELQNAHRQNSFIKIQLMHITCFINSKFN
jgi:hypothetical protein